MIHNQTLRISIVCNVILAAVVGYWLLTRSNKDSQKTPQKNLQSVVVLTPATHPSLEAIEYGFRKKLTKLSDDYEITTLNANGSKPLMRSQAEQAIAQNPALILSIGMGETLLTRELLQKKGASIPHIFAAVADPASVDLKAQPLFNGTVEHSNYQESIEVSSYLIPNLTRLLLVYDPQQGNGFALDREEIEAFCEKKSIALSVLEVYSTNEVYNKVANVIRGHEAVMILKDNTTASAVDALVKLCNQYSIPLITHHLDAFDQGASISFGANEADYGTHAAQLAYDLLRNGSLTLPTFEIISRQLIRVAPTHNLNLPEALKIIVKNTIP